MPILRNAPELLTRRPATTSASVHPHHAPTHTRTHFPPSTAARLPSSRHHPRSHAQFTHPPTRTHARPRSAFALARRRVPIRRQPNLPKAATLRSGRQKHSAARRAIADLCDAAQAGAPVACGHLAGMLPRRGDTRAGLVGCVTRGAVVQSVGLSSFGVGHGVIVGRCLRRRVWGLAGRGMYT
jgi:hypothetical protein